MKKAEKIKDLDKFLKECNKLCKDTEKELANTKPFEVIDIWPKVKEFMDLKTQDQVCQKEYKMLESKTHVIRYICIRTKSVKKGYKKLAELIKFACDAYSVCGHLSKAGQIELVSGEKALFSYLAYPRGMAKIIDKDAKQDWSYFIEECGYPKSID